MRSLLPLARVTSSGLGSLCSIPISCCGLMPARARACRASCVALTLWPAQAGNVLEVRPLRITSSSSMETSGSWHGGPDGRVFSVIGFTIADGKIVEIDILADPERLSQLDLSALDS